MPQAIVDDRYNSEEVTLMKINLIETQTTNPIDLILVTRGSNKEFIFPFYLYKTEIIFLAKILVEYSGTIKI